jgi:hypothetical protein
VVRCYRLPTRSDARTARRRRDRQSWFPIARDNHQIAATSDEIHVSAQTTAGRPVNGRTWPFQNVERLHLIEARHNAISIKDFSLSVLEKLRVTAANIWNAIQAIFRRCIGTGRELAKILNGENLAILELRASNDVDRTRGIDEAHILAEHGVNRTCRGDNLIFAGVRQ